jgi:ADP-heptose:LPS heptosyltransferase
VLLLKRKFFSALWRLKQATIKAYGATTKYLVEVLTERYWLLDYLPTFTKKSDGVLLVRLDLIGDFVLWLDSAQTYRRLYPKQRIAIAVNSACADLARALPHWDEVLSINVQQMRTSYIYRLTTLVRLRRGNFSVAIQPTFSREFVGDLAVRASLASERIGYDGDVNNLSRVVKDQTDNWYTRLILNDPYQIMELNINAHFMRELGAHDFKANLPIIPTTTAPRASPRFASPYIVVAPGASWGSKMWPVANFAQVITKLIKQFNIQVVYCGGQSDQHVCRELHDLIAANNAIDLSGMTSLPELVEIIRGANLLITNDSAPVHIAAAVGTPSVCILGGGHFGRFLPYPVDLTPDAQHPLVCSVQMPCFGCKWRCIYSISASEAVPCISAIAVTDVYEACHNLLKQEAATH